MKFMDPMSCTNMGEQHRMSQISKPESFVLHCYSIMRDVILEIGIFILFIVFMNMFFR